nr:MAG TPA: hypothetical protein [Siphoviridae sp. cty4Z2]DAL46099.1 MAG TPA_asm: hypothetical protein [Caudoviricetes sp.]
MQIRRAIKDFLIRRMTKEKKSSYTKSSYTDYRLT